MGGVFGRVLYALVLAGVLATATWVSFTRFVAGKSLKTPSFVSLTPDEAAARAAELGLSVQVDAAQEAFDDAVPAHHVRAQLPAAETAVKVGLRLQPGQDLFLTAPVSALPLARPIVVEAAALHRAGRYGATTGAAHRRDAAGTASQRAASRRCNFGALLLPPRSARLGTALSEMRGHRPCAAQPGAVSTGGLVEFDAGQRQWRETGADGLAAGN